MVTEQDVIDNAALFAGIINGTSDIVENALPVVTALTDSGLVRVILSTGESKVVTLADFKDISAADPIVTTINDIDYIRVVLSSGEVKRILLSNLKDIIRDTDVIEYIGTTNTSGSTSSGVWANPAGHSISVTEGKWKIKFRATVLLTFDSASTGSSRITISDTSAVSNIEANSIFQVKTSDPGTVIFTHNTELIVDIVSTTTYYLNLFASVTAGTITAHQLRGGDLSRTVLRAERITS